jgi:hypothetical protein
MNWNSTVCFFVALSLLSKVSAEDLDVHVIGKVFGYPPEELVITDVTEVERKIYSVPTLLEADPVVPPHLRSQADINDDNISEYKPQIPVANIRKAYRITGKKPATFHPMLITLAESGTFLGKDFFEIMEKLAAVSLAEKQKENMTHLGRLKVDGIGSGGVILGEIRTPSTTKEMPYPTNRMALIAELRTLDQKADIRIAIFSALDGSGNSELAKIPGGESYYSYFRTARGTFEDPLPDVIKFDWSKAISALFRVATNLIATKGPAHSETSQKPSVPFAQQKLPVKQHSTLAATSGEPASSTLWPVVAAVIATVLGLLWMFLKMRK